MNHPQLIEIGTIQRTHGVNGEVQVSWTNDFDPQDHKLESVFLLIDGIPIPFLVQSIRGKGSNVSIIHFDEIDELNLANELVGLKVFGEIKQKVVEDEFTLDDLVGYYIVTSGEVLLGRIEELQDYGGNLVFQVINSAGHELLIPATSDFILDINEDTKTLLLDLPEGLADL
jgi:16S rRNA processing protein RimM